MDGAEGRQAGRGSVRAWVCRAPRPELQGAEDPQRSSRSSRNSLTGTGRVFRGVMDSPPHTHTIQLGQNVATSTQELPVYPLLLIPPLLPLLVTPILTLEEITSLPFS